MYSYKQVRSESMPLLIVSIFFLLHLVYWEEQPGLETVAWFKEAGLALTSHVRRLQVNFGVSWSDESRASFTPAHIKSTTSVTDIAGLYIEVSREGHFEILLTYDTKVDERALRDMRDKVGQSRTKSDKVSKTA
jgi:hypothetical protein